MPSYRYNPPASVTAQAVGSFLGDLSKNALIDLYCQQLALNRGEADREVTLVEVIEDAEPMLKLRGDRVPSRWRQALVRGAQ